VSTYTLAILIGLGIIVLPVIFLGDSYQTLIAGLFKSL
jgi:hypothetical protein